MCSSTRHLGLLVCYIRKVRRVDEKHIRAEMCPRVLLHLRESGLKTLASTVRTKYVVGESPFRSCCGIAKQWTADTSTKLVFAARTAGIRNALMTRLAYIPSKPSK